MRKFRAIVETNIEPQDREVLWFYKKQLLYWGNDTWESLVSSGSGSDLKLGETKGTAYEGSKGKKLADRVSSITGLLNGKVDTSTKGVANGVATLDTEGKVPLSQLPEIPSSLELGEVEGTAYEGNKGAALSSNVDKLKNTVYDLNTSVSNLNTNVTDLSSDVAGLSEQLQDGLHDVNEKFVTGIKSFTPTYTSTDCSVLAYSHNNNKISVFSLTIPTESKAGLFSYTDKSKLDSLATTLGNTPNFVKSNDVGILYIGDDTEASTQAVSYNNSDGHFKLVFHMLPTAGEGNPITTELTLPFASKTEPGIMSAEYMNALEDLIDHTKILTQEQYDALSTKDPKCIYYIKG